MSGRFAFIMSVKRYLQFYYLYLKHIKSISFTLHMPDSEAHKTILLISHDMANSGAPILLFHIAKQLKMLGWNIIVVSKLAGPLVHEFSEFAQVYVCRTPAVFERKVAFLSSCNVSQALLSSAISGDWADFLSSKGFTIVSLVHEMPGAIEAWGAVSDAKNMATNSSIIVFPSSLVKEKFEWLTGIECESKILPQGLYLKPLMRLDRRLAKDFINTEFGLDGKPIILNVATGNHRKGFDLFVKMASLDSSLNFVWVGDIDQDIMETVAKIYSVKSIINLHLVGYIGSLSTLSNFYAAASVLSLTSREEPFGSIVLEAMYAGTPVIGFEGAGGFQDVVKNGETGYLVEYENIQLMLQQIKLLISSDTIFNKISNRAKSAVSAYDFPRYVNSLVELFQERK